MSKEKQIKEMGRIVSKADSISIEGCEKDDNYGDYSSCILCEHLENDACLHERYVGEALYNAGYRKQEWINVGEALPERPGVYLVFTCDRRISMCHFIDHYCDGNMQFDDYRVTHWMPLPEAPKGGNDK